MNGRCVDCRFWTRTFAGTVLHEENPDRAARVEEWGECGRAVDGASLMRPYGHGWDIESEGLDTHESFGCVEFDRALLTAPR